MRLGVTAGSYPECEDGVHSGWAGYTPSDFVETAVRGRIGDLEPLASTPPDIAEAAIRRRGVGLYSAIIIALSD